MAAAFPLTVSTAGRLLFLSCFMKSPERRRKVVSDWMSLVMSSIRYLLLSTFLGAIRRHHPCKVGKALRGGKIALPCHFSSLRASLRPWCRYSALSAIDDITISYRDNG